LNVLGSGKSGIGTTSPGAALTLDRNSAVPSSTIAIHEYAYGTGTTTAERVSCNSASQTHIRIGNAAVTITLADIIDGQTCRVVVENPNTGTPGAITWAAASGYLLLWAGGTTPLATATNNKQDVYSFLGTQASSTLNILGAQSANF
jgi:hypothetical protein